MIMISVGNGPKQCVTLNQGVITVDGTLESGKVHKGLLQHGR